MKLCVFLVTFLALVIRGKGRIASIGSYSDDFAGMEFPDERDDCSDGLCSLYAEKRMIVPEKVIEQRPIRLSSKLRSINLVDSFNQWRPNCGCTTEHKLVNLGEGYYPSYIKMAQCKTKTGIGKCYQCKYLNYRVHVLVKRGLSSILKTDEELDIRDVEELPLPESLHVNWQLFGLSVPVACIAAERSQ